MPTPTPTATPTPVAPPNLPPSVEPTTPDEPSTHGYHSWFQKMLPLFTFIIGVIVGMVLMAIIYLMHKAYKQRRSNLEPFELE
jgi:hypothetical protein